VPVLSPLPEERDDEDDGAGVVDEDKIGDTDLHIENGIDDADVVVEGGTDDVNVVVIEDETEGADVVAEWEVDGAVNEEKVKVAAMETNSSFRLQQSVSFVPQHHFVAFEVSSQGVNEALAVRA